MFHRPFVDDHHRRKSTVMCANCGGIGHVYKTCNHPIISYGIICYKAEYDPDTNSVCPKYLMVQRKDSLCYVEFIRGKYDLQNRGYLQKLLSSMTPVERDKLRHHDFDHLWNSMWCRSLHSPEENTKNFNKEFKEAKEKFETLQKGYYLLGGGNEKTHVSLQELLACTQAEFEETEWGFPKGRRNINENDIACAIREFREETGILSRNIKICRHIKPLEEIFTGSNRVRYKHIYYVAKYVPDRELPPEETLFNPQNKTQVKEVKDVQWFRYQQAQDRIRTSNVERKELFKRLNQLVIRGFQ